MRAVRPSPQGRATLAITLLYPESSLLEQFRAWCKRCPESVVRVSFATSAAEVEAKLEAASMTVVDATSAPARARIAFREALRRLASHRLAVYSDVGHEALEREVRSAGALFLLGPMSDAQWDDLLAVTQLGKSPIRLPSEGC